MYSLRLVVGDEEIELTYTLDAKWTPKPVLPVDTSVLVRRPDPPWPVLIDPALDPGTLEIRYGNRVVGRVINIGSP